MWIEAIYNVVKENTSDFSVWGLFPDWLKRFLLDVDLDVDLVHDQFDLEYFPSSLTIMIEVAVHGVGGLLKDTSSLFRDLITKNLKLRLEILGLFVHEWVSFLGSIRLWREDAG